MREQLDNRLPISVCMVSGAEAHRIRASLDSVRDWVSEIVVVLNEEVQDGTEEILHSYGARVYREPWKGFKAQKNSVTEKASQPWVLGLDADEVVSEDLQKNIKLAISSAKAVAYDFPRLSFLQGRWIRHGDWYPDRQIRLWQKGKACWSGEDPHAHPVVDGKLGHIKGDLLHYTNESLDRMIQKITPYSEDFYNNFKASGKKPSVVDLGFRPFYRFFRAYFLRLGFLDGWQGYFIAWTNAYSAAVRYSKTFTK